MQTGKSTVVTLSVVIKCLRRYFEGAFLFNKVYNMNMLNDVKFC